MVNIILVFLASLQFNSNNSMIMPSSQCTKITACTLDCPDACSLLVTKDQIEGNPDHPFTSGFICKKGRDFLKRLRSPHRITSPLLRSNGKWHSISWQEALDLCTQKIQQYRQEPASILHFHGEGAKGVLKQASKLFFALLGSSQAKGSLCDAAGYLAFVADFGSRDNNDITDILNARTIVNWGKDLSRSSIHTAALVRKARRGGTQVMSISPGGDGNGPFSDASIRIRPGTDRFLATAVIRLFIERDLVRSEILAHAKGWEGFRETVMAKPLNDLASKCDVPLSEIDRLFQCYAGDLPVATLIGAGLQRYRRGGENVQYINALAVISGNMGRSGGGSYFHLHSLRNLNLDWTKDPNRKPRRSLLMPTIGKDILNAKDPPIRMIWVNGSNVVNQAPDSKQTARAFEAIDFKVVVDAFMTDTAERADLVLPCTLMLEQEDVVASYLHNFVQYASAVFEPPGKVKSDYEIVSELGKRLDPPVLMPDSDACFGAALDTPLLNTSLEELRSKGFVRARRARVAYPGMQFDHPDGRYRFPLALSEESPVSSRFPLRLVSALRRDAVHSQILPEQQDIPPFVWVSPDNPVLKNLALDRDIFVVSPLGRLRIRLKFIGDLHPQVVLYRRGDWLKLGGGINQLIAAGLTDIGRGAPYYEQWVGLEN